jgi:hypothetical protein
MGAFFFMCGMGIHRFVSTPLVYRIIVGLSLAFGIEIVNYQGQSEQASLFLKSEVALRQSKSTNKAFYEIPVGIVIVKHKKPSAVRF